MSHTLVCIDRTSGVTHTDILNRAIGASEYQFYSLLANLKKTIPIRCYNHLRQCRTIDSIEYKSLYALACSASDIVLIQRFYPIEREIRAKIIQNRKLVWIHDIPDMNIFLGNDNTKIQYYRHHHTEFRDDVLLPILNDPTISFIANSTHTYHLFMEFIHKYSDISQYDRCSVIYNILYGDEFDTTPIPKIPKRLIYASAWQKGIWKVIDIFRYIVSRDAEYSLTLLSPGYDWQHFNDYVSRLKEEFGDKITILGPSTKRELCIAIKESVCCLSSTFNETFGCVFAESIYLGTPVIADKRSGAVREIIGDDNIVDYNHANTVYDKLQHLSMTVTLSPQFLPDLTISKWITLVSPDTKN